MAKRIVILSLLTCLLVDASGFAFSKQTPVVYCKSDQENGNCQSDVPIYVNRLDSAESALAYNYDKFDFCRIQDYEFPIENFGQFMLGERIRPSPYKAIFLEEKKCRVVCKKSYEKGKQDEQKLQFIRNAILKNYQQHLIVDKMPIPWCYATETGSNFCSQGFPVGCYVTKDGRKNGACVISDKFQDPDTYYVFNHVDIVITYQSGEGEEWGSKIGITGGRIVGARLTPKSIKHQAEFGSDPCSIDDVMGVKDRLDDNLDIVYSYSISFEESNSTKWLSRWDYISYELSNAKIQWFSTMNSFIIVVFLGGMLALVLLRTLRRCGAQVISMDDPESIPKHFRWMLVHEDVFRAPRCGMLLSVFLGSGAHVGIVAFLTLLLACLGHISPANPGSLATYPMVLFVCLGTPAGYVSSHFYKMFGGKRWIENALLTSLLCPGIVFALCSILNVVLWIHDSSGAIPFMTWATFPIPWLLVTTPLVFLGAHLGFKCCAFEQTMRTGGTPREIPKQRCVTRPVIGLLIGGILPFGSIIIQLFFTLRSIWSHQMYSTFEFPMLVFVLLVITCAEITVMLCYFHLLAEDYRWVWRSFLTSGFTAFYVFAYCVHYFNKLAITGAASIVIYFGVSVIMAFVFFLFTGTVGFLSCWWFVGKIFSAVKYTTAAPVTDPVPEQVAVDEEGTYDRDEERQGMLSDK